MGAGLGVRTRRRRTQGALMPDATTTELNLLQLLGRTGIVWVFWHRRNLRRRKVDAEMMRTTWRGIDNDRRGGRQNWAARLGTNVHTAPLARSQYVASTRPQCMRLVRSQSTSEG